MFSNSPTDLSSLKQHAPMQLKDESPSNSQNLEEYMYMHILAVQWQPNYTVADSISV